jgi:hypothetical protein
VPQAVGIEEERKMLKTDNDFADWFSTAKKGAKAPYFSYYRWPRRASDPPNKPLARAREENKSLHRLALKVWDYYEKGLVTLTQEVVDNDFCRYMVQKTGRKL